MGNVDAMPRGTRDGKADLPLTETRAKGRSSWRTTRTPCKAVRDSQRTKQDAMDEYVAARVSIKSLEGRLEEAREKAALLRRKAKDAGNTSAELKTADDLIDARWTGTEDGSPENTDPGTVNPEREHPAMEGNMEGGMPGEPNRWEGGES